MNSCYDPGIKLDRLRMLAQTAEGDADEADVDGFGAGDFRFVCGDLADEGAVGALFSDGGFDVVVNLAAQAGVHYSIEDPGAYMGSNLVEGVVRVMANPPEVELGADGLPKAAHRVYNIGNSSPENLLDFVETLQRVLVGEGVLPQGYDFGVHRELVPMQPGDVPVTYADTSALGCDIGFRPSTPLEDGLREFARWCRGYYGI